MSGPRNTMPEQYYWHNPSSVPNSNAELALANVAIIPGNLVSDGSLQVEASKKNIASSNRCHTALPPHTVNMPTRKVETGQSGPTFHRAHTTVWRSAQQSIIHPDRESILEGSYAESCRLFLGQDFRVLDPTFNLRGRSTGTNVQRAYSASSDGLPTQTAENGAAKRIPSRDHSVYTRQAPATNLSGSFALLLDWFSHAAHQLHRRPTEFGTEVIAPITYW